MEINMRRDFIRLTTAIGTGLLFSGCGGSGPTGPEQSGSKKVRKRGFTGGDLMREHGVLDRVLLIYGRDCGGWTPPGFRSCVLAALHRSFGVSLRITMRSGGESSFPKV